MQQKLHIETSTWFLLQNFPRYVRSAYPSLYVHASQGSTTFPGILNFKNTKLTCKDKLQKK
jgi:hypothetical protein